MYGVKEPVVLEQLPPKWPVQGLVVCDIPALLGSLGVAVAGEAELERGDICLPDWRRYLCLVEAWMLHIPQCQKPGRTVDCLMLLWTNCLFLHLTGPEPLRLTSTVGLG